MSDDAKVKEARAALLLVAQTILAVLKEGDDKLILLAADTLEGVTNSARLTLESAEAQRAGLN